MSAPSEPVELATAYAETGTLVAPTNPQLTAGKSNPSDLKIGVGLWNWLGFWQSNALRYLLQRGIPLWRSGRDYVVGSFARDPNNSAIYRCIVNAPATGTAPSVTRAKWALADEPAGRRVQWRQGFQSAETLTATSFGTVPSTYLRPGVWVLNDFVNTGGTATLAFAGSDGAVFDGGYAAVNPGSGAADIASLQYQIPETFLSDKVCLTLEWDATLSAVGANGADAWMVIGDGGPLFGTNNDYIAIVKRAADTNWKVVSKGTTQGSFVDLGVAPVAAVIGVSGSTHRFKIMWVGASHNGGTAKALVFVDGALVTTLTTNLPAATRSYLFFGVINNGTTGRKVYVSDVAFDATFV